MKTVPSTGTIIAPPRTGVPVYSSLDRFVETIKNGHSNEVVGVFIPGVLALPVGQQPKNDAGFVTRTPDAATQFRMAGTYGTIGILAHNDLAGAQFSNIKKDQYAVIVYGTGRLAYYIISDFEQYQALMPTSTFSDFVDLSGTRKTLTAGDLFTRIYGTGNRLVFQTCIAANGDPSWGRLFIIARPATRQVRMEISQSYYPNQFASYGVALP